MKKMLFWGHIGNVHHPLEEMHHLSPARSQGHAKAFAEAGYDVTMAVFHRAAVGEFEQNIKRVHIFDLRPEDYDVFFLNFQLAINQLYNYANGLEKKHIRIFQGKESHFQSLLAHPHMAVQLDAPRSFVTDNNMANETKLLNHIKHIGISTHQGMTNWEKMRNTKNHFLCYAATLEYRPPKGPDPFPQTGRKRVLYLGRLNDASEISSIDKIEEVAKRLPDIDFIVVSCKIRDKNTGKIITPMLTDKNSVTREKLENAKKLFTSPNIILMPGPRYSDTFNYMYHADIGLGFAVRHGQDACSCKTYEYLGSGLPVILEDAVPEAFLLNETECGVLAKTHDFDDIAGKIESSLRIQYNREEIMKHFLSNHSYAKRVNQYEERFLQYWSK